MHKDICCICNKKGIKKKTNINQTIYQCPSCKLWWLDLNNTENSEKAQYVKSFENFSELRIENYNTILNNIQDLIPTKARGLEVGSACGVFLNEAQKRGYIMSGIEPMAESFLFAKEQELDVYNGFFPQDLPNLGGMDFIIFNDVFEHIPEGLNAIKACYSLLNDEGILIINLPISSGALYRVANILDKFKKSDYLERMWQIKTESPHLYYYNKDNLEKLLSKINFKYIKEIKMKTFKIKKLKERISAVFFNQTKATALAFLLVLSIPILNFLPKDTSCYIYKKS